MNTNSSGHHQCLPWFLGADPGRATEDLSSPCSHCGHPAMFTKVHTVINNVEQSNLNQRDSMPPQTQCHHMPHTRCPAPLDPEFQHVPRHPLPQVKVFPYQGQSIKSGRGNCFFKCADSYTRLQSLKESGKYDPIKGIQETSSNWPPKKWRSRNCLTKINNDTRKTIQNEKFNKERKH